MKTTILMMAVHPPGENPVFSEKSTHVRINDEGGGPFLTISQIHDHIRPGEISIDFEELDVLYVACKKLRDEAAGID